MRADVAVIGRRFAAYPALRAALDALPGWGPVTIGLFLRELRGVWPGANPPLDERAVVAARHHGQLPRKPGLHGAAPGGTRDREVMMVPGGTGCSVEEA